MTADVPISDGPRRVLVAGWFSFEDMGATAGDVSVRDTVSGWLERAEIAHDVAVAAPFRGDVDWRVVDPLAYSHIVFVCGPFGNGEPLTEFLSRFGHCRLIGVNLSIVDPLETWDPFFELFERDSSRGARPDLALLGTSDRVPVIGRILRDPTGTHPEGRQADANMAIERLLSEVEGAVVEIDTALDINRTGLRTPAEIESLIAQMDVVVTTRLHGLVLSLKHGVPAVVVDPVPQGGKISRQAKVLGWPFSFTVDRIDDRVLRDAFDRAVDPAMRNEAADHARAAVDSLSDLREQVISALA